jgi:hypothetical protein
MFLDALLLVSDAQAVSATAFSTNTIDLGDVTPKREVGTGEELGFGMSVDVAADATTGDETYTFEVVQSANADLTSPDVLASRAIARADLKIGTRWFFPVPMGAPTKRYIGMRYTLGGTTPSITVTTWLTARSLFSIAEKAYAKGYAI